MIGNLVGLQHQWEDVRQIGTSRFLVHRALIEVGALALFCVGGEHVYYRYGRVQDLGRGFNEAGITTIPTGSVEEETIDVYTWNSFVNNRN